MTAQASVPLVSIIVPVCNGERYLRDCLDSILAQSYPRIEVLVMDDASTDRTPEILASYGDRIRMSRQPATRGIYGNVNDGIAMASGEYIAAYHADDLYDPAIVEREVAFLERNRDAGAVFCIDIFIDAAGREIGRLQLPAEVRGGHPLPYPAVLTALLTYKNRFLRCPTAMVRAGVYREVGVYRDRQFLNSSDMEMWLRIARRYPIGILEEYLLRYRRGHESSSERYHRLRTDPERYFGIVDLYLEEGGRALVSRQSLCAHEAHRAEDSLMRTVSAYILGRSEEARRILREVRPSRILGSGRIQRGRLFILFLALHVLVRLPRMPWVAELFYRRWHAKSARLKKLARLTVQRQGVSG